MPVRVRQVAHLVDEQQIGRGVVANALAQQGVAVQRRQIAQQLPGGGEQHRLALDERLVGEVAGQHRFAHTVGADQHHVGGIQHERQRHQFLHRGAVALLGPIPVEVGQRLEAPDVGRAQLPLQAAPGALGLLPGQRISEAFLLPVLALILEHSRSRSPASTRTTARSTSSDTVNAKGKVTKRYRHADVKTPLAALKQLCAKGLASLKSGVTVVALQALADAQTDLAAAQEMQRAKATLFELFNARRTRSAKAA